MRRRRRGRAPDGDRRPAAECAALNRTFINVAELTMRAALEESREHVYPAVMLDPNAAATLTIDTMTVMVDELIDAHGDLLPVGIRRSRR